MRILLLACFVWSLPLIARGAESAFHPAPAASLLRLTGALVLVLAIFFAGIWCFRNWQRLNFKRGKTRLQIIEARSLANRQALYVIGYDGQRFLVGASGGGLSLLTQLADESEQAPSAAAEKPGEHPKTFPQIFSRFLEVKP